MPSSSRSAALLSDNTHARSGHNNRPIAYAAHVSRAVHALFCSLFLLSYATPLAAQTATTKRVMQVVADLADGRPDADAERLVLELGALRSDLGLDALRAAMLHRVVAVRIAALRALGNFVERADVAQQVARGLRDSDPLVRAAAAGALASMNARTEVGTLLIAFDRGVPEAAVAIGQLGDDNTLTAYNAFLGRQPIALMLAGYHAWLTRSDVRLETKLSIVATLENVAGVTVKRFLQSLIGSDALGDDAVLRRAIATTISHIPETPTPAKAQP